MPGAVGFIGLGNMGGPMALNLAKNGFSLVVHDVARDKVEPLRERGARVVASPEEVAAATERTIVMVETTAQAESVIAGAPDSTPTHAPAIGAPDAVYGCAMATRTSDLPAAACPFWTFHPRATCRWRARTAALGSSTTVRSTTSRSYAANWSRPVIASVLLATPKSSFAATRRTELNSWSG